MVPYIKYVYIYIYIYICVFLACEISSSSNDGLRLLEDLICLTKFSMAAKFIEKFIFLQGIGERIHVQNLKVSFIYLNIDIILFVIP